MSTSAETLNRMRGLLKDRFAAVDPLVEAVAQRLVKATLLLAAGVVLWLLLVTLVVGQLIVKPSSSGPETDRALEAASESIAEVVNFANSTAPVPAAETVPQDVYPEAIDVAPLAAERDPFLPLPVPDEDASPEPPIGLRGIVSTGGSFLAVLTSENTSQVVRPGDTFMGWRVLGVKRDRVGLKKNGKVRTIVMEGSN